jgi:hypothetical protein
LTTAALIAGLMACGRTSLDDEPAEPWPDASLVDASFDSSGRYVEATAADSLAAADQGAAAADSAVEASTPEDAAGGLDATADASTNVASDANADAAPDAGADATSDASADAASDADVEAPTGDAGEPHLPCDTCGRGNQECGPGQEVCTANDAGTLTCAWPGITTCVVGDAGCAVWGPPVACRSDVPCCVPCEHEYECALGSIGNPCEQDTDCASNACDATSHQCITDQCGDGRQDGEETDVDCGGYTCDACRLGQGCQSNFDCIGGAFCSPSHQCE